MKKKTAASKTYVKDENPELRKVVLGLRSFVKQIVPKTKITLNSWGIPTFEANQPFCFYMVGKRHITFGFHNGTSLKDSGKLLEGTGKNIRHVKLRNLEDLKKNGLRELVQEASQSQGKPPMRGMGGKK